MSLIGFDKINNQLSDSYHNNKLHHAILLSGKQGIGKASFALSFIQNILNNFAENNPDILFIQKDEGKKEITVDKIRKIFSFVTQTSAHSKDKFIIIDSVCNLNKSASNALLKILEEPRPNNYIFLISHNLNKVLPTIRSRCFILKANGLEKNDFKQIITQQNFSFNDSDIEFLSKISNNSPALALEIGEDLKIFYELFLRSLLNEKITEKLSKMVADKNFNFDLFIRCYEFLISRLFKSYSNVKTDLFYEEEQVFEKLKQRFSYGDLQSRHDENITILYKTIALNLSKKLSFINAFQSLTYENL